MADLLKRIKNYLLKIAKSLFTGQWHICINKIKGDCPCKAVSYRRITPPKGRFYADPFIFKKGNINYIFYEDYRDENGKGVISCISINEKGSLAEYPSVLARDYHLSYPFVFELNNQVYMIPETSENKTIEMYRATDFPKKWELEKVLIEDINAVDATLVKHNDLYWLFAGVAEDDGAFNSNLHLYYSDSPFGEWKPHPGNPVVSDTRRARPAGKLFYKGNILMRPGQDCSLFYGRAVWIHRIDVLNETSYREVPVGVIKPSLLSGSVGVHTFNFNMDYEVVDYKAITRKRK